MFHPPAYCLISDYPSQLFQPNKDVDSVNQRRQENSSFHVLTVLM